MKIGWRESSRNVEGHPEFISGYNGTHFDSGMTVVAKEISGQARNDRGAYCYFWRNTNKKYTLKYEQVCV